MTAPLAGVRVVEAASFVAVPAAGTLLADLGADVIKVEVPGGEVYRHGRPAFSGYETEFPESPAFQMDNRGKRSIVLDLSRPEARDALQRLIEGADVFITNLLPARREKYGLDYKALNERFPRLIMGAISGYGAGGPRSEEPGFDYTAYWARTGMMDMMRDANMPPVMQRPGVGDHAAAVNLVAGILAAMRVRDQRGEGSYVDVALRQVGFHILGNDAALALITGQTPARHDRQSPPNPLWNTYPCAGDRWILLAMVQPDRYWPKLCQALGREDLLSDERFAEPWERSRNAQALVSELEQTFLTRSLEEWHDILDAAGLIWAPVNTLEEATKDPTAQEHGYFCEVEHDEAGAFTTVAPPFRIQGMQLGASRAASKLGADTEAVLREVGLSDGEIEKLKPE